MSDISNANKTLIDAMKSNLNLMCQSRIKHQIEITHTVTIGLGLTLKMFNWYSTAKMIYNMPENVVNGIKHYYYFKTILEILGTDKIIPDEVAKRAF